METLNFTWLVLVASLHAVHVYSALRKDWRGNDRKCVLFEDLMVLNVKITGFWDCGIMLHGRKVPLYQTTGSPICEGSIIECDLVIKYTTGKLKMQSEE